MKEVEFAYRVRQALNEGAGSLDELTLQRLASARATALARRKQNPAAQRYPIPSPLLAFAGRGSSLGLERDGSSQSPWSSWLFRLGVAAPVVALVVGFISVYQWREAEQIDELAAIDLALLLDDQPLSTYADRGFGALLEQERGL
ncbi:MAG TPA: DUF3619 family protein [Burkholderiaceae bacterium]|nr:DUF3619 family protein [Burkholderiaceae bacterium]